MVTDSGRKVFTAQANRIIELAWDVAGLPHVGPDDPDTYNACILNGLLAIALAEVCAPASEPAPTFGHNIIRLADALKGVNPQ